MVDEMLLEICLYCASEAEYNDKYILERTEKPNRYDSHLRGNNEK